MQQCGNYVKNVRIMPKMFDKPYIECVDYGKCVDFDAFFETNHNLRIMVFRFN